jgi:hypothetical protein
MNEKTFSFALTQSVLDIIGAGLGELPFKVAAPLVNELNRQIQMQEQAEQVETHPSNHTSFPSL